MAVTFLAFTTACEDDPVVVPPSTGIPVGDGIYVAQAGVDPVATSILNADVVEDEGFANQERAGFLGSYMYLTAGNYNFVKVVTKEITETYGGAVTAETHETGNCEILNYTLVNLALDGAAVAVATDGLYRVTYDTETAEAVFIHITNVGIIGSGTSIGWTDGETEDIAGSVDATGGAWSKTGVVLRPGEYKLRFNCNWVVDRRIDSEAGFAFANGYQLYTNFGGVPGNLVGGGANMPITDLGGAAPDDGIYTFDVTWDPTDGFDLTLTRTGDNEPLPTFVDMYLVGAGTAYGWAAPGVDTDPAYVAGAEMHKVAGGVSNEGIYWKLLHLEAGQGFKIAANNWGNPNLGFAEVDEYDVDGVTVSDNGGNMDIAVSGMYMVVLNLQNDMTKVSVMAPVVYGMGDAFGDGAWTEDDATALFTFDDAAKTVTSPAVIADATGHRMYADHPWIPSWWQAEFVLNGTNLEYRNDGGDPVNYPVTAGQVITLTFDSNTGVIN